ncbi:flagellar biosynthesis protein FliQ [Hankyongella ginsenosidimutans]|uniref:Flagellar biosynthetic protein FliQ n=1 Tax=Hankyongella ginsenosidimutans TaxID=1763828 RepID=A0A4D7CAE4_9SPHN|nr:flagellar biosynthesis protein FliQ [Hankyongella ginsenosidimutans]QCI80283.1 flagellar biosynthesis protein FliQ [Hankyongella ginsenosidimutans]
MTGPEVLDVARDALTTLLLISAPVLVVTLLVGLGISLFQALTQIQEMTLTFVPKLIAVVVVLLLGLPFMGQALGGFMSRLADRIISG